MTKRIVRFLAVATAIVSFAGCEAVSNEQLFAPSADVISSNASDIAKTRSLASANRTGAVIGQNGGQLTVGGHTLTVPANAVSQPTVFSMQVVEANAVHVKLRAWRNTDGAAVTQFPVPVRLTLDISDVQAIDLSALTVVYLVDGTYAGAREIIASMVDTAARTISADLSHFSDYTVILD